MNITKSKFVESLWKVSYIEIDGDGHIFRDDEYFLENENEAQKLVKAFEDYYGESITSEKGYTVFDRGFGYSYTVFKKFVTCYEVISTPNERLEEMCVNIKDHGCPEG